MVVSEALTYDTLLDSIELMLDECSDKRLNGCDKCKKLQRCRGLWDQKCIISSHDLLDSFEARKAIMEFKNIMESK